MKVPLESVERVVSQLWEDEASRSGLPRIELLTLVVLVAEPQHTDRARQVVADFVRVHPSRTILARWVDGEESAITAEVALHRTDDQPARGDAIALEATAGGREWLPDNIERLALADLPVCVWWVGDLPDFDHLIDRMLGCADVVVVNSEEMDLRDLGKLSDIATRSRGRYALNDLTWVRLRPLQELVARFFDDEGARSCLRSLRRVTIEFAPRERELELDVACTQAGLLFGWIANALGLDAEHVRWQKSDGWAEAALGHVVARFEPRKRADVPPGTILRVTLECEDARFDVERQDDPFVFRWSREVPGGCVPPQTLRMAIHSESALLVRSVEATKRDALFEASLRMGSRIVRSVAPRLSVLPSRPGA